MKIAVISDIHANFHALLSTADHIDNWRPDLVLVAGDIVNRGPRPIECLHFIQDKMHSDNWMVVRGNHEDYVIKHSKPDFPHHGPKFEIFRNAYWTFKQLNCDVKLLEDMPFMISKVFPKAGEFRGTHASMRNNRDGIYHATNDNELSKQISPPPAVICVGHTHRPLIRHLNGVLIVNAGSSGLPFDGETRPSYAQIIWHKNKWEACIVRVPYDVKNTEQDFRKTGFLENAGPLAELILLELRIARSQLYQWTVNYMQSVLDEEITMEKSVREYLKTPNYW